MTLSSAQTEVEALERAQSRLETFLDQSRICYLEKKGIISKNVRSNVGVEYTIFITDVQQRVDSFNIVLNHQEDLKATKENKAGYVIAKMKDLYDTYSSGESVNTIYCSYILNQDTMIFKPLRMMLSWFRENRYYGNGHKSRPVHIRVQPKEVEKHIGPGGSYTYYLGKHATSFLQHKEPFVIRPKELEAFLSESNKYPNMWKLNFKTIKNILDQGV